MNGIFSKSKGNLKKSTSLVSVCERVVYFVNFGISVPILWLTPLLLLMWLLIFTAWLAYLGRLSWSSFAKTWLPILALWYVILAFSFPEYATGITGTVIIGGSYTEEMLDVTKASGLYFKRMVWHSIILLHFFSHYTGVLVYIPVFRF